MVSFKDAVGSEKLQDIKSSAREEVGFSSDPQPYDNDIGGKRCGHDGCNWNVPKTVDQTDGHELENNQHGSLLEHIRDEHDGLFPFEVENQ